MAAITEKKYEGLTRISEFKLRLSQCTSQYGGNLSIAELIKALQEEQTCLMREWLKHEYSEEDEEN